MTKLYLLLLLSFLTACGSPAPRVPDAFQQSRTIDKDARRALQTGDLLRAQYNFTKVLALQQSVDDTSAAAITMLNLATVAYRLEDQPTAFAWLDKIILEQAGVYSNSAHLSALFRKSVILSNTGKLSEAESSLQLAGNLCEQKCAEYFGIKVLQARLLLLKGEVAKSRTLAEELSKQAAIDNNELGNAIRVQAAAEAQLALYLESFKHYQLAFEIDKKLALTNRIAEDLTGLSVVANKLGHRDEAVIFARRAELIKQSSQQNVALKHDKQ